MQQTDMEGTVMFLLSVATSSCQVTRRREHRLLLACKYQNFNHVFCIFLYLAFIHYMSMANIYCRCNQTCLNVIHLTFIFQFSSKKQTFTNISFCYWRCFKDIDINKTINTRQNKSWSSLLTPDCPVELQQKIYLPCLAAKFCLSARGSILVCLFEMGLWKL